MITRAPPPSATKRTLNQLCARRSGLGPSPGSSRRDNQRRADGTWASHEQRAPAPAPRRSRSAAAVRPRSGDSGSRARSGPARRRAGDDLRVEGRQRHTPGARFAAPERRAERRRAPYGRPVAARSAAARGRPAPWRPGARRRSVRRPACRRRTPRWSVRNRRRVRGTPSGRSPTVKSTPRSCGTESNPRGVHEARTGRAGRRVVAHVHPVDELRLTGQVDIVGARPRRRRRPAARHGSGRGRRSSPAPGYRRRGRAASRGRRCRPAAAAGRRRPGAAFVSRSRSCSSLAMLRPASAQRQPWGTCAAR